jgi:hypothetical protein
LEKTFVNYSSDKGYPEDIRNKVIQQQQKYSNLKMNNEVGIYLTGRALASLHKALGSVSSTANKIKIF